MLERLHYHVDRFIDLVSAFTGAFIASQLSTEFIKIAFGAAVTLCGKELILYIKKRRAKNNIS